MKTILDVINCKIQDMSKTIGYIGLGKMGLNMTKHLVREGWRVVAYDSNNEARKMAYKMGVVVASSFDELVKYLPKSKVIFMMVPHKAVAGVIKKIKPKLSKGDIIIDGGNSYFGDSMSHHKMLKRRKIAFLDAGVSGGPSGALKGACVMVGGDKPVFKKVEKLFSDISLPGGYLHAGESGAGHFAKMIHNGIEYGMMQSLAEGFSILKKSLFNYDLQKLARLYNTGSVIESRLVGWLEDAYEIYGKNLKSVSSVVAHTGEGDWTVKVAKELKVNVPVIYGALKFRKNSSNKPKDYTGKILSALRNRFGGHPIKTK